MALNWNENISLNQALCYNYTSRPMWTSCFKLCFNSHCLPLTHLTIIQLLTCLQLLLRPGYWGVSPQPIMLFSNVRVRFPWRLLELPEVYTPEQTEEPDLDTVKDKAQAPALIFQRRELLVLVRTRIQLSQWKLKIKALLSTLYLNK